MTNPIVEPNTSKADKIITIQKAMMEHPWAAIDMGLVYTLDSVDLRMPIKKFPKYPWLREITELWLKEPLFACPKSRRMQMSWLMVWNHLWLAMFHEGAQVFFQSETADKSNELVQRAEFMYNHIPSDAMIKPSLKRGRALYNLMEWPGLHSFVKGVAEGANQLRQFTATAVLADEIAFWSKARESIGAFKPTAEGGGRITLISSFQVGPFRDLCFDQVSDR